MRLKWTPRTDVFIHDPGAIYEMARARRFPKNRETFYVFVLDAKNRIAHGECVSIGTLTASLAHPREVFRLAVRHAAASIILVHNHPSGNPTPSREDIEITERLAEAGRVLGIDLLDHVILGSKGRFESLREMGYL
ncbi:MAG: DNA repair protein RadC [Candidatus Eisenbacteria bacterium]